MLMISLLILIRKKNKKAPTLEGLKPLVLEFIFLCGDLGQDRTVSLSLRRRMLYPLSYEAKILVNVGQCMIELHESCTIWVSDKMP